eukprot:8040901-Alexandrium_andersonii.AAC.1
MSASLVGSEMCIRDRETTRMQIPGHLDRMRGLCEISPMAGRERRWRGAVSYTHLTLPTICSV